ncbi:MAG: hypothetical protein N4A57_07785 [Anaeromicrobium sp.]|jgi:hypothetical protein|uniref:hypothetical protein n=1 Tax=Anaeromicrobium sp. TaxID=1929132 RepID=UPI0025E71EEC|nr:hypothetical protein [Anaeromicrobium sp.]MCT4594150.1 hypothetical protein [Anaeromicrobium sp.]
MKGRKGTVLDCCLKAFTGFVACVTIAGLLALTFSLSWVISNNVSPEVSRIMTVSLGVLMVIRMAVIYFGTHKAMFEINESSWKRRSLAFVYSLVPSAAGLTALRPVYGNKRNI